MHDTIDARPGTPGARTPWGLPAAATTAIVACWIAGLLTAVVGLPGDGTVFGTAVRDLSLPVGLLIALGGTAVVAGIATRAPTRVVDLTVASVLGVALGFVFVAWNAAWTPISNALAFYPPLSAVLVGVWLVPAVLGGLVIRKPGAAVYCELVAAVLSALVGNQWGFATVEWGLVEGLGAEVVFALVLYRWFGLPVAILAGAGAGAACGAMDVVLAYTDFGAGYKLAYLAMAVASGAVIAGLGGWLLQRGLARSGALAPLASGRSAELV